MRDCGCPIMEDRLYRFHRFNELRIMFEEGHIKLGDIDASDWMMVRAIMYENNKYKRKLAKRNERIRAAKKNNGF